MFLSTRSPSHSSSRPVVAGAGFGALLRRLMASRTLHFLWLAMAMTALSFGLHAREWAVFAYLDSVALDGYFKSRGEVRAQDLNERLPHTRDIVLVETTHQLPRPILTRLIHQLRQARVVAFDMMFVDEERLLQPDDLTPAQKAQWYGREIRQWRQEDASLADAVHRHGRVVLGTWPDEMRSRFPVALSSEQSDAAPNPSDLESSTRTVAAFGDKSLIWQKPSRSLWHSAWHHAHLLVAPDAQDSSVRQVNLYDGPPGARQPALGLTLAASALGVAPSELKAQVRRMNPRGGVLQLGKKQIPYGPNGVIPIDFSGGRTSFEGNSIKYKRVLDDDYSVPEDFKDKIIIIGEASETSKEIMKTPFGLMPGMQIHANVAATILETRSSLQPLAPAWIALLALCGSLLLVAPLLRFPLWTSFVVGLLQCAVLFYIGAWIFVHFRRILPFSVPVVAMLLTLNGLALYEYRRARATLGAFIGSEMLPHALSLFAHLRLGGKTEEATAWFCDLRGYSSL
ncbi:MAG TPA: CHASE2 domain-containing protein, partial [Abditibacteriaceae bacterium]|nr:CHASE2 domain-containing protein [Abditibacteriaceae bacterium]